MKKLFFISLLVFLLVVSTSCNSQTLKQDPTLVPCMDPDVEFHNNEEFLQLIENSTHPIGRLEPIAQIPFFQLFQDDEIEYGFITPNHIFCSFFVPENRDCTVSYYFTYDPAYEEMSLTESLTDFWKREPDPITIRTEPITQLKQPIRNSTEENANFQIFTVADVPVAYGFYKGKLIDICFSYKSFFFVFLCNGGPVDSINLDGPTTSSYLHTLQNLTDPVAAEQEMQRIKDIIDTHLENFTKE